MNDYLGNITDCYSTAGISGAQFVGGVVGYSFDGVVKNCYATGSVKAHDYEYKYTWTNGASTYEYTYEYQGD